MTRYVGVVYRCTTQIVELNDVTLVLPRWEAVHATGGGQWGAELRDDYYGGVSPSRRLLAGWGRPSKSSAPEMPSIVKKACPADCRQKRARRPGIELGLQAPEPYTDPTEPNRFGTCTNIHIVPM